MWRGFSEFKWTGTTRRVKWQAIYRLDKQCLNLVKSRDAMSKAFNGVRTFVSCHLTTETDPASETSCLENELTIESVQNNCLIYNNTSPSKYLELVGFCFSLPLPDVPWYPRVYRTGNGDFIWRKGGQSVKFASHLHLMSKSGIRENLISCTQ
jgi:hypothetical protein